MAVTMAEAEEMLVLAGMGNGESGMGRDQYRRQLQQALSSGAAARKFQEIIEAQGGNPAVVDDPAVLPQAREVAVHTASRSGHVAGVDPRTIGRAIIAMGGGRRTMEDVIDPSVGFVITAKPGDRVKAGEALASIYARDPEGIRIGAAALEQAIGIVEDRPPASLPLVSHRVTNVGVELIGG